MLARQSDFTSRLTAFFDNLIVHFGEVLTEFGVGALEVLKHGFVAGFVDHILRQLGVVLAAFRGVQDRVSEWFAGFIGTDGIAIREYIYTFIPLEYSIMGTREAQQTGNVGVVDDCAVAIEQAWAIHKGTAEGIFWQLYCRR